MEISLRLKNTDELGEINQYLLSRGVSTLLRKGKQIFFFVKKVTPFGNFDNSTPSLFLKYTTMRHSYHTYLV